MTTRPPRLLPPVAAPWTVPGAWVAAVGGALLLAVVNTIVGFTPGRADVQSTAAQVRLMASNPALNETIVMLGVIAVFLLVPGGWAIAVRLAPRSAVLAAIGGWAFSAGYIASMLLNVDTLQAITVARSSLDPDAYGAAVDASLSPVFPMISSVFFLGALGGAIILGVAILRQHGLVPAWLGWVLIAAEPVRLVGLIVGIPVGPPLASLMIAVAFAGVLVSVQRAARAAEHVPAAAVAG